MAWLRHPIMAALAAVVFVLGMGNFIWFARESSRLGGDAGSGYERDGHYFVGSHGQYREVSREDWEFSQLQARSLIVSHPLAMLSAAFLMFGWLFPAMMGRERPDTPQRVAQVRASGPPLASAFISARLGVLNFRGPLLRVSVHPGGLVLQPILMPSRAILASELVAVDEQPPAFGGLRAARVVLRHTAPDVRATVFLYVGSRDQLTVALRSLLPR